MEMEKIDKDKEELGMKKQVRRRVLSSNNNNKPYKERLMDMAEARREIATALKFHRASINQQQQQPPTASNQNHNYSAPLLSSAPPIPNHYHPISPPPPLPLHYEHLNLALPNQTLGLNLNFQDFNNLSTTIYHTPMPVATKESSGGVCSGGGGGGQEKAVNVSGSNHGEEEDDDDGYDEYHPFEQVMEFPPWLINANESSCLQDHHFCDEYLPWMDIGEIEGMDGEWLA